MAQIRFHLPNSLPETPETAAISAKIAAVAKTATAIGRPKCPSIVSPVITSAATTTGLAIAAAVLVVTVAMVTAVTLIAITSIAMIPTRITTI